MIRRKIICDKCGSDDIEVTYYHLEDYGLPVKMSDYFSVSQTIDLVHRATKVKLRCKKCGFEVEGWE